MKTLFILLSLCPYFLSAQTSSDHLGPEEKAIMAVIHEETRSYFERDFEAFKNTHVLEDYYREHKYWEGWEDSVVKSTYGWAEKVKQSKKQFQKDEPESKWDISNYEKTELNIRISDSGDMAWVTFFEKAFNPQTKEVIGQAYGTRVMEKQGGQWKIAYLGYHYLPEKK